MLTEYLRLRHYVSGTTVLGAFDPIEDIASVCQKYQLYLHVDAAWGTVTHTSVSIVIPFLSRKLLN